MPGQPPSPASPRPAVREIDLRSLLDQGGREVVILHKGERYRLRVTARDKLILTK